MVLLGAIQLAMFWFVPDLMLSRKMPPWSIARGFSTLLAAGALLLLAPDW